MTPLTTRVCNAFNILGPKDTFASGVAKMARHSSALSEQSRSRLVSMYNRTLRDDGSDAAKAVLGSARRDVATMKLCPARDSLRSVMNHLDKLTSLAAASPRGLQPQHLLDSSLADTRPTRIQPGMTLAEAFACKLGNQTLSRRSADALRAIFAAELRRPDFAQRREGFRSELSRINSAVRKMEAGPARVDLKALASAFADQVRAWKPEAVAAPQEPTHVGTRGAAALIGSVDPHAPAVFIDWRTMSLEQCFGMKLGHEKVSAATLVKLDKAFMRIYRISLHDIDDSNSALAPRHFGLCRREGFRNLPTATADLAAIRAKVEAMPAPSLGPAGTSSPAQQSLLGSLDRYERTIEAAKQYFLDVIQHHALNDRTVPANDLLDVDKCRAAYHELTTARTWLGWSRKDVVADIAQLRPVPGTLRPASLTSPQPDSPVPSTSRGIFNGPVFNGPVVVNKTDKYDFEAFNFKALDQMGRESKA